MVEQTAVLANTGQLVTAVVVRVPSDTRKPVMTIQVPVGLWLPAGLVFQIDEAKPQQLPVQTCDLKGCYAETPVSQELLAALKAGKSLAITFQTLAKENFSVPLPLVNFAEVYQKIQ